MRNIYTLLICFAFMFVGNNTNAQQNLVPNPSFESFANCPTDTAQFANNISNWYVTSGTPDYYNTCANNVVGVPTNLFGSQTAATGDGYGGFFAYEENDYREYMAINISDNPMKTDKLYCVQVRLSLADDFIGGGIENIGVHFSEDSLSGNLMNTEPQLVHEAITLAETQNWMQITGVFQATGDYNYLAIGNFFNNANSIGNLIVPGTNDLLPAYYYIDDVSVIEIQEPIATVSPQNFCANDVIFLSNSQTDNFSTYEWFEINDPNTILATTDTFQISAFAATYIVRKIVEGCALTDTITISPNPIPEAFFTAENVCEGNVVQFIDQSTGVNALSTYEWDIFNDGTIDFTTSGSIEYLFNPAVVAQVSLTVSNGNCSNQFVLTVDATQPCDPCDEPFNLVPNGDMEVFDSCPTDLNTADAQNEFDYIATWEQATLGTPDFFNDCFIDTGGNNANIPDNEFGTQFPVSGSSYAGFYALRAGDKREYLTTELIASLYPSNQYCIELSVSLAETSSDAIENIGVHLSEEDISDFSIETELQFIPTLESSGGAFTNTESWSVIVGAFVPADTVNHITIGNFRDNDNTVTIPNTHPDAQPQGTNLSYYYIDNISIIELPEILSFVEVEGCVGDIINISASNEYCTYLWQLADGTTLSDSQTLQTNFNSPGLYEVFVTASLGNCSRVEVLDVLIQESPVASFQVSANCKGESSVILNTSAGFSDGTLFDWYIDNNFITTTNLQGSFAYNFPATGTYNVQLVINDAVSDCQSVYSEIITINDECNECAINSIVPNGSFEIITECPEESNQIELTNNWFSLANNSPAGYYNECATNLDIGVPDNLLGNQMAYDGFAYSGVTVFGGGDFRSHLATELVNQVNEGEQYCVSFYVNLADNSEFAVDDIGAYFSETNPTGNDPFSFLPQINSDGNAILSVNGWVQVSGVFTAAADYDYLTIGNFTTNNNTATYNNGGSLPLSYCFIDDVSVVPIQFIIPQDQTVCLGQTATLVAQTNLCNPQWINQTTGQMLSDNAAVTVQPNVTTTYAFRVETETCGIIEETVIVTVLDAPNAGDDIVICENGSAQLNVIAAGNSFSWTPTTGLDNPNIQNPIATPTITTTYTVAIDGDGSNCPNTDEVTVFVDEVNATIASSNNVICNGDEVFANVTGGDTYAWLPVTGVSNPMGSNVTLTPSVTTTYQITVSNSTSGCSEIVSLLVTVGDCDEGGPQWIEGGLPVTQLYDTTDVNVQLIINFPVIEDPDLPNDSFTFSATDPDNGTFSINNLEGTYIPDQDFVGNDTLIITVCDVFTPVECSDLEVIISVFNGNEPPQFPGVVNLNQFANITVDSIWNFCFNIVDPEGEEVVLTIQDYPTNGTAQNLINTYCIQYNPQGFVGQETMTILACDEQNLCTEVDIFIQVSAFPFAPEVSDTLFSAFENLSTNFCIDIFDVNSNIDTIIVTQNLENGTILVDNNGCMMYTPNSNFSGVDILIIEVCDLTDLCTEAEITIVVEESINAEDDSYTVEESFASYFLPTNNDVPQLVDTMYIVQPPYDGMVEIVDTTNSASIIYTPTIGSELIDSLSYAICSEPFGCDTAWIFIDIQNQLNANDDEYVTAINEAFDFLLTENDSIPDVDEELVSFSLTLLSNPTNGTLVQNANGGYTYEPNTDFTGSDSFTYQICANDFYGCTTATVNIIVTNAEAPEPEIDYAFTDINEPVDIDVLNNDTDPQGNDINVVPNSLLANNGVGVVNANGTITYTPNIGFIGTDTLYYNVVNGFGLSSQAFVIIEVAGCDIEIQEALTPNNDGFNDVWKISALLNCQEFEGNEVFVYNRWGNIVFEAKNYGQDGWWNGTWQKNDEPLPVGTYFYVITLPSDKRRDWQRGAIEIIR